MSWCCGIFPTSRNGLTEMSKRNKILYLSVFYVLLLAIAFFLLIGNFTQKNFAILFVIITLGPVARFVVMKNGTINAWLNQKDD